MKLFFVNVECEVRTETRDLPQHEAAAKPFRTFTYAVVAATEREATSAIPSYSSNNWYEIQRYAQDPNGHEVGEPIFHGSTDHSRKHCAFHEAA